MTNLDRTNTLPGYYPSHWPVECGGNRRQKAAKGGLNARDAKPNVTTVTNGRWNVMTVWRGPAELYMGGTQPAFSGPPPFGWLQRLDPETLDVLVESPPLPCGDHVWCGAIAAHANGDIYKVNGSNNSKHSANNKPCKAIRLIVLHRMWKFWGFITCLGNTAINEFTDSQHRKSP